MQTRPQHRPICGGTFSLDCLSVPRQSLALSCQSSVYRARLDGWTYPCGGYLLEFKSMHSTLSIQSTEATKRLC